jgi:hypothetical protein
VCSFALFKHILELVEALKVREFVHESRFRNWVRLEAYPLDTP